MVVTRRRRLAISALTYASYTGLVVFCLFPFAWMLDTAFKPIGEVLSGHPTFWISRPTLGNFVNVLHSNVLVYFRNSVIVGLATTLLTMTVSVFCAYALSRWPRVAPVRLASSALVLSQMIPGVLLLVPLYILIQSLGLLSTYGALVVTYCTFAIPLCVFMLKSFFDGIAPELEEAAELDGCDRIGFMRRVLLPLCAPGLLATGVFVFITSWNEFMFGYVLVNDESVRTLTPGIMIFRGPHMTDWGGLMAASVIAVVPVAAGFVWLQRFLIEGLSAGAVKG